MNTIAIVDDEPDMRTMICALLTRDPRLKILSQVSSAAEAISAVRQRKPDLIVLDHLVHGPMTGLEAALLIRAAAPHTKIVVFSAYDLRRQVTECDAIDAFASKDHPQRLLLVVQRLLALSPAAP